MFYVLMIDAALAIDKRVSLSLSTTVCISHMEYPHMSIAFESYVHLYHVQVLS